MPTTASSLRGFANFFHPDWMDNLFARKPRVKVSPKPKLSETKHLKFVLSLELPETTDALTVTAWEPIFTGFVDDLLVTALAGGPEDQTHPASWVHVYHVDTPAPASTVFSDLGRSQDLRLSQNQVALYGRQWKADLPEGSVGMCICMGSDDASVYITFQKHCGLRALMANDGTVLKQGDYVLVSA
jgi:hypothetical protein